MAPSDDPTPGDDALVASALGGDVRAFETLVRRHEARVLRVLRLLGVKRDDREDVTQEVFLRVFRHLAGYRAGASFSSWIYKVAVNAARDWRERAARTSEEVAFPEGEETAAEPERRDERLDLARRLEEALALLTDRERAVFVLKELEGLETAQVAAALGVTTITVRRHLGLAKDRLRKALEKINRD